VFTREGFASAHERKKDTLGRRYGQGLGKENLDVHDQHHGHRTVRPL